MSDYSSNLAHVPRKRFGQHFLHDQGILRRIVECISPQPGERLVEIGPGEGAMTLPLLRAAKKMTAIELDRDLIEPLREKSRGVGELDIINADVLTVDFGALADGQPLRIVGNLPYNISTPILFHCLDYASSITDMHFMLQKEVVERMAAAPGSKVYGRLSVMLQFRCSVEPLLEVPPSAFRPPPKVDSAIVRLTPFPADVVARCRYRTAGERGARRIRTAAQNVVECAARCRHIRGTRNVRHRPAFARRAGVRRGFRASRTKPQAFLTCRSAPRGRQSTHE